MYLYRNLSTGKKEITENIYLIDGFEVTWDGETYSSSENLSTLKCQCCFYKFSEMPLLYTKKYSFDKGENLFYACDICIQTFIQTEIDLLLSKLVIK